MKRRRFFCANARLLWRIHFLVLIFSLALTWPARRVEASYIFQYTGTVRSVGGTVTDGSLLPFLVESKVAGSFTFDAVGQNEHPGSDSAFFSNSIAAMNFGGFLAVGT